MKTATVTDFRNNMKDHLEAVENDQDILILSGPRQKDFVVLTLEVYNSMQETAHLLSTPANTSRLMQSIKQDQAGKVFSKGSTSPKSVKNIILSFPEFPQRIGRIKRTTPIANKKLARSSSKSKKA